MTRRRRPGGRLGAFLVALSALLPFAVAVPTSALDGAPRAAAPGHGPLLLAQGLKEPVAPEEDPAAVPLPELPPNARFGTAQPSTGSAAMSFPAASMSLPGASAGTGSVPAAVPGGAAPAASAAATGAVAVRAPGSATGGAEEDAPPDRLPPGATLGMAQMALTGAAMHFDSAHAAAAGTAALPGGMEFREEGRGLRITLDADVLFDFDKAELRRDAGPRLQRLMEEVQARVPRPAFRVEGHTDWIGSDAYNLRLSARRAEAVRNWLVQAGGVPRPAISTVGYGESRPVAPNSTPDGRDDPEGRQRNRRVELLVTPR